MPVLVHSIFRRSTPSQIFWPIIPWVAVKVSALHFWCWRTMKRLADKARPKHGFTTAPDVRKVDSCVSKLALETMNQPRLAATSANDVSVFAEDVPSKPRDCSCLHGITIALRAFGVNATGGKNERLVTG
jgi:hypothetical protein